MSYSRYAHAANTYREREVMTASPVRLVVIVYDHVLANLRRAVVATNIKNVPAKIDAISKARDGIAELLVTLDVERGGAIARNLQALYTFMLTDLVDSVAADAPKLERHAAMISDLRDAFSTIASEPARVPAA